MYNSLTELPVNLESDLGHESLTYESYEDEDSDFYEDADEEYTGESWWYDDFEEVPVDEYSFKETDKVDVAGSEVASAPDPY